MSDKNIIDIIGEKETEQLLSVPAQRLKEKLSLLKNRVESAKKRWFWELLQNASDYNKSVNVKLLVTDTQVTFLHDGAPFSITDVLNLISPDSNKQDDDKHQDNIGKFGTGLVSTHILSSIMDVEGLCENENEVYKFSLSLNRSCFLVKQALIEQITRAKDSFKESLVKQDFSAGFNTSFSYRLGQPLPELPPIHGKDIDLENLCEVLPYTLCFMPKVQSVVIEDRRTNAHVAEFRISRKASDNTQCLVFAVEKDSVRTTRTMAYFSREDVSSVFQLEGDKIAAFPAQMPRLFCGLPLVGTEEIGMPFLLNSQKFDPTTEREGVELDPNSNLTNSKLFKTSVELYGEVLEYVAEHKLRNAFHLARLCRKYNGTQASNQQFYTIFLHNYKKQVLAHDIVCNGEGQFIPFANILLPFKDSKPDQSLYDNCKLLKNSCLPAMEDYSEWFEATDFSIFTEQKYTCEDFAKEIEGKINIYSFGKTPSEALPWLKSAAEYFKDCDRFVFSKHKLLPSQSGILCSIDQLYADNNLPEELKIIFDSLYEAKEIKIENDLLDKSFNDLDLLNWEYSLEMLAKGIDQELSEQFSQSQGNTAAISEALNRLYSWISKSDLSKENLAAYFHWYYPKRATLIVDMLTDTQREQALLIAKSGKMEALATLADSELTEEELRLIVANIGKLPDALNLLSNVVDDKAHADSQEGDCGEKIVFEDLLKKYPRQKGYKVVWASRDRNEPCYDFEITKDDAPFCYCDAKTTTRGIANADSIPFFMRKSQWEFLHELDDSIPYIVARVFLNNGGDIKYMRVSKY